MTTALPDHTLMVTYLTERMRLRRITVEHLADLLQPTPEATVRSWITGWSSPAPAELNALAIALQVDPVELIAGWLIDNAVVSDRVMRDTVLDPLGSSFPRPDDELLIAPRRRPDMSVGDPHDEREPSRVVREMGKRLRKRSLAAVNPKGAS